MKNKINEWIKKVPETNKDYPEICAEMIMHFGRAVECVENEQIYLRCSRKYHTNSMCSIALYSDGFVGCFQNGMPKLFEQKNCKHFDPIGLPIHIARAFVCYLGWIKGTDKNIYYGWKCKFDSNILSSIQFLTKSILSKTEDFSVIGSFENFAKAHNIPLAEAVKIVLKENENE